jgi:hypothetical protein
MNVIQLHLWMMDKKHKWTEPEVVKKDPDGKLYEAPGKRIVIEPSGPSVIQMKMDVARELDKWIKRLEYYYVVAVAEKSDGTPVFRTIVPKTVVT